MILRGAQIHRNGNGKCGLLPNPTLSRNYAPLPSASVFTNTGTSLFDRISLFLQRQRGQLQPTLRLLYRGRNPFHATRARYRLVREPRA